MLCSMWDQGETYWGRRWSLKAVQGSNRYLCLTHFFHETSYANGQCPSISKMKILPWKSAIPKEASSLRWTFSNLLKTGSRTLEPLTPIQGVKKSECTQTGRTFFGENCAGIPTNSTQPQEESFCDPLKRLNRVWPLLGRPEMVVPRLVRGGLTVPLQLTQTLCFL